MPVNGHDSGKKIHIGDDCSLRQTRHKCRADYRLKPQMGVNAHRTAACVIARAKATPGLMAVGWDQRVGERRPTKRRKPKMGVNAHRTAACVIATWLREDPGGRP
jgi:hypothetical protein